MMNAPETEATPEKPTPETLSQLTSGFAPAGGFGEERMCPLRLGVSRYLLVYNTGLDYRPTVRPTVTDCSQEFHPIHVRHTNVGEDNIDWCLLHVTHRV